MKSVMEHKFSQVPTAEIQRASFDRSHGYKTTFNSGYLVPVFTDEALPGDTFNLRMAAFARMATPIKPILDNLYLDSFFFAVPYRLLWENWERFNGAQDNPGDSTDYVVPQIQAPAVGGIANGDLSDYFGLPTQVPSIKFNSLHHRAYNLIWNTWFRDQNMQDSVNVPVDDGPDTYTDFVLLRRGKRHDYFTSCLPWPQKGPDVTLPLGSSAPIVGSGQSSVILASGTSPNLVRVAATGALMVGASLGTDGAGALDNAVLTQGVVDPNGRWYVDAANIASMEYADLSSATAATINSIREAFQLQRMYERDARGGTRYTEILKAHFNVTSPDARLQRPEYLGGGSSPINVHPVPQTGATMPGPTTPQGNLAAFATASFNGHGFTQSFTEHCVIIGLINVRADLTYQQGMNRMWSRRTRFDYYWPALSHLGEQAVLNQEIYCDGSGNDILTFGYQERFAEYRYKPSLITGQFRSNYAQTLDSWHLSQEFGALPTLSDTFIVDFPPIARVIAVPSEPEYLLDTYFTFKCARPMPVYGVPGLVDHF